MILLSNTKTLYSRDEYALSQYEDLFGDISSYAKDFDIFWENLLPQAIYAHRASGVSEWAGSGCVDYNEAKGLYIFVRVLKPKTIIELGYAGGISTSALAKGIEDNGEGLIHTVDLSPEYWDVCDLFKHYMEMGIINQYHTTDAVDFLRNTNIIPDLTFTDATHELEPTKKIAALLKEKWPNIIHLYHEWGMSHRSGEIEKSYVSMKNQIGGQYERDAFEEIFGEEYRHGGLVGSCGLGIVMPI